MNASNRQLSGFFMEENWLCWECSLYQKCSVSLKYAKNALATGAQPRIPLGELMTLPRPPRQLGRGTSPPQSPLPLALSAP